MKSYSQTIFFILDKQLMLDKQLNFRPFSTRIRWDQGTQKVLFPEIAPIKQDSWNNAGSLFLY